MAGIFGSLTVDDTNKGFISRNGQVVLYDMVDEWLMRENEDFETSTPLFIEDFTEGFKERYPLPGGGYLQKRNNQGRFAAAKASGNVNVAFPIEDNGVSIAWNDVTLAKMTGRQLENHIVTTQTQNNNTFRFEMLKRLFDNVQTDFEDEDYGDLEIEPLANGDVVKYPPVVGSRTDATEDHYLGTAYVASAISDTNNPLTVIRPELTHHFGAVTGGRNIVVFCNSAQSDVFSGLQDFREVADNFVMPGDDADQPFNFPQVPAAAQVLGRSNGCWVVEWDEIAANYLLSIDGDVNAPLKVRVDESDTGLPRGLALVATDMNSPFTQSVWRNRFGIGCANRLNGVVMFVGGTSSYTIPTIYQ